VAAAKKEATDPRVPIGEAEVITAKFYVRQHDLFTVGMFLSQMTTDMSICRKLFSVLSSFIAYRLVCLQSKTSGARTANFSGAPEFTRGF